MAINSKRNEEWRDIPGYEGAYQASNLGEIKSLPRTTTKGGLLKQYINKRNGYCYVSISKDGKTTNKRVHCMIARTFFGECPSGLQVNHIDGNKTNNAINNLEYCTPSENMKHAFKTGLQKPHGSRVIDLNTLKVYESATEAARAVGNSNSRGEMVLRVCRGEKSHYRNHRFVLYDDFILANAPTPTFKGKYKKKACESLWR